MTKPQKDAGVIQVLLQRLNERRLPEALQLKEKVDRGECLDDYDMRFLEEVLADAGTVRRLAAKYPEYQSLVDRLGSLYAEIIQKALENQQKAAGGKL
jgi:hypothetical protein